MSDSDFLETFLAGHEKQSAIITNSLPGADYAERLAGKFCEHDVMIWNMICLDFGNVGLPHKAEVMLILLTAGLVNITSENATQAKILRSVMPPPMPENMSANVMVFTSLKLLGLRIEFQNQALSALYMPVWNGHNSLNLHINRPYRSNIRRLLDYRMTSQLSHMEKLSAPTDCKGIAQSSDVFSASQDFEHVLAYRKRMS